LVYEYNNLSPDTVKRIDIRFPEGLIPVTKANLISHKHNTVKIPQKLIVAFIVIFIGIILFWILYAIRMARKYAAYNGEMITYDDLPSNLEPALLGRMLNSTYYTITSVYATFVFLAQKGVTRIQSLPKTKWYETAGSLGFEYVENEVELTPTEQATLEEVFGRPPVPGVVTLLDLQKIMMKSSKYLQKEYEDELIKLGFIDPFQVEKRKKLLTIGLIITFLEFMLLFFAIAYFRILGLLVIIPFALLMFISLSTLMAGGITRIFTESGMMEIAAWNAYAKNLRKIMKEPNTYSADEFNRIFPYALVMNLGKEWVSYFKKAKIDLGVDWLVTEMNTTDSWAPFILISNISSPSSGGGYGGAGGGSAGGGGGGGGSGAG
jgi:uncharacterized membrane protein YgcG